MTAQDKGFGLQEEGMDTVKVQRSKRNVVPETEGKQTPCTDVKNTTSVCLCK